MQEDLLLVFEVGIIEYFVTDVSKFCFYFFFA